MGNKVASLARMPRTSCKACHGIGSIRLTVHFHSGDQEWETPCWECFGSDAKLRFPTPQTTDN